MHNIRDVHPERHEPDGQASAVLQQAATVSLFTVNRILFFLFACLMALVVMLGFLLFPANSLLSDLEARQHAAAVDGAAPHHILSAEVNALKGQVVELVSSSIESKLRNLEENIRADNITAVDLGTIQDIKNDIRILRSHSDGSAAALDSHKLDAASSAATPNNRELLSEFSQLKYLIYISIASCGLMTTAIGVVWMQNRYRLAHDKIPRLMGKDL